MKLIKHFPLCPSEKCVGAGQHHLLGLALPTTLPEGSIFFSDFLSANHPIGCLRSGIDPASRQKTTQSPETKQTLLLKALFNRGFFLVPWRVYMM